MIVKAVWYFSFQLVVVQCPARKVSTIKSNGNNIRTIFAFPRLTGEMGGFFQPNNFVLISYISLALVGRLKCNGRISYTVCNLVKLWKMLGISPSSLLPLKFLLFHYYKQERQKIGFTNVLNGLSWK